jgi:hypothetical protein
MSLGRESILREYCIIVEMSNHLLSILNHSALHAVRVVRARVRCGEMATQMATKPAGAIKATWQTYPLSGCIAFVRQSTYSGLRTVHISSCPIGWEREKGLKNGTS